MNDLSSVSGILTQKVNSLATLTVISLSSQLKPNGQTRTFLVASTSALGGSVIPTGTVVFRKNGHTIGSARLKNGKAVLALLKRAAQSGRFVARFEGSAKFGPSSSAPLVVG